MTREQMMDKVIATRGFEDEMTVWFCRLCEDETLADETVECAMNLALYYQNLDDDYFTDENPEEDVEEDY